MNLNFLLFEHAQTAESSICVKRVPKIHIFNILNLIFTVLLKIILNFRGRSKIYNSKFSIMFNCSFFLLNCYFSAREWFDRLTTRERFDRLTTREWLNWLSPKKVNLFMHIPTVNSALNTIKTYQNSQNLEDMMSAMYLAAMQGHVAADCL
jgi:hypothetical protein